MPAVFVLHHVRADDEYADDAKLIGVYSSKDKAEEAIKRLTPLPGFCLHPAGFQVDEYELDEDNWTTGFGGGSGAFEA